MHPEDKTYFFFVGWISGFALGALVVLFMAASGLCASC